MAIKMIKGFAMPGYPPDLSSPERLANLGSNSDAASPGG